MIIISDKTLSLGESFISGDYGVNFTLMMT